SGDMLREMARTHLLLHIRLCVARKPRYAKSGSGIGYDRNHLPSRICGSKNASEFRVNGMFAG
ncbi:MAG: hypothetical protein WCY11_16425, partial [Novosphingobium sp.]